jgi:pectate lyase
MKGKNFPLILLGIILIALPLLLIGVRQTLENRSHASPPDQLETESGVRSGNANIQTDSNASGGNYVALGINQTNSPTPTITPAPNGALPAFPGASGGGAESKGGRGGAIIEVTNLNDSGSGSLRACIDSSGPRTCVFRVGGTINLTTYLYITNPYLTIAGQTAPGGGIQLNGKNSTQNMIDIGSHDITVRYIKIRKGYNSGCIDECGANLAIFSGSYNIIFDHTSSTWNQDEGLSAWNGPNETQSNITFSWNLVAEGLSGHSTGYISGANEQADAANVTNMDIHHNLTMNNSHRNPLFKHKSGRIVNNLFYNQRFYTTEIGGGMLADIIGNKYKKGPMYGQVYAGVHEIEAFSGNTTTAPGTPSLYLTGNIGWNQTSPTGDQWVMAATTTGENGAETGTITGSWRRTTPLPNTPYPIIAEPATNLENSILPTVGASQRLDCNGSWVSNRDSTDLRLISQYQNNTGITSIPSDESAVGGFPIIAGGTACTDSDHDGMPDSWESAKGLNPNNANDRNNIAGNGYTQLENYLNGQ